MVLFLDFQYSEVCVDFTIVSVLFPNKNPHSALKINLSTFSYN